MDEDEIRNLPTLSWMPSRIPIRDALAATFPKDVKINPDMIPKSYEQRWYPQEDGGLRLLVVHEGQPYDESLFQYEPGAWDHTTCDLCNDYVAPMTLCYVTRFDPHIELCAACYLKHVAASPPADERH